MQGAIDRGDVPAVNMADVRPYIAMDHFTEHSMSDKNAAAGSLCAWVISTVRYYDTIVLVEPKRQALVAGIAHLNAAQVKVRCSEVLLLQLLVLLIVAVLFAVLVLAVMC
jgi:dynein heavy chain, axonemal